MSAAWCWSMRSARRRWRRQGGRCVLLTPRLTQTMRSSSSIGWTLTALTGLGILVVVALRDLVVLWRETTSDGRVTCRLQSDRDRSGARAPRAPRRRRATAPATSPCAGSRPTTVASRRGCGTRATRPRASARCPPARPRRARRAAALARSVREAPLRPPSRPPARATRHRPEPGRATSRRQPPSSDNPRRCSSRWPVDAARRARRGSTRTRAPRLRHVRPQRCARSPAVSRPS